MTEQDWTDTERWVWECVSVGKPADFHKRFAKIDIKNAKLWTASRTIRGAFLRDILTGAELSARISVDGLRLKGARIRGDLDLEFGKVRCRLDFNDCRIDDGIHLLGLKIDGLISFKNCLFLSSSKNAFDARDLTAENVFLRASVFNCLVQLGMSEIRNQLDISGSKFPKGIECYGLRAGELVAHRTTGENLNAESARIAGRIEIIGTRIRARLNLRQTNAGLVTIINSTIGDLVSLRLQVDSYIALSGSNFSGSVALSEVVCSQIFFFPSATKSTKIAGELNLEDAKISGRLNLSSLQLKGALNSARISVGGNITFGKASTKIPKFSRIDLMFANIGGDVEIYYNFFSEDVTMNSIRIGGDLVCYGSADEPVKFMGGVDLANANIRGSLRFSGVHFDKMVLIDQSDIGGNFLIFESEGRGVIFLEGLDMKVCRIGGDVSMNNMSVNRSVDLSDSRIAQNLFISGLIGEIFSLNGATLTGGVYLRGLTAGGTVDMSGIAVGGGLEVSRSTELRGAIDMDYAQFSKSVIFEGVRIGGNLSAFRASIGSHLRMGGDESAPGQFEGTYLNSCRVGGSVELLGGTFNGPFFMTGATIGTDMNMQSGSVFETHFHDNINLTGTAIGRDFLSKGGFFHGDIDLNSMRVDRAWVSGSFMKSVDMAHIQTMRSIEIDGSFEGSINMSEAVIGTSLLMRSSSGELSHWVGPIIAAGAQITRWAQFSLICVHNPVSLERMKVGGNLSISAHFRQGLDLSQINVMGSVDLTYSLLGTLRLNAGKIQEQLLLGISNDSRVGWIDSAEADLRNLHCGILQDYAERSPEGPWRSSWPEKGKLKLDGFSYLRLGGQEASAAAEMLERPAEWYVEWLSRDEPYGPDPYEQLAPVLRGAGEPSKADAVMYASRERARAVARRRRQWARWTGMTLICWTIGYGIGLKYFRALGWATIFTVIGVVIIRLSEPSGLKLADNNIVGSGLLDLFAFSADQLLPIVELDGRFDKVVLTTLASHYFYFHRLVGFLLSSFIAAGLAGLTQRPRA